MPMRVLQKAAMRSNKGMMQVKLQTGLPKAVYCL
jgi:hypothetical protein